MKPPPLRNQFCSSTAASNLLPLAPAVICSASVLDLGRRARGTLLVYWSGAPASTGVAQLLRRRLQVVRRQLVLLAADHLPVRRHHVERAGVVPPVAA